MQISSKVLLNSAEGILKERKKESSFDPASTESEDKNRISDSLLSVNPGELQDRLMKLQLNLGNTQDELSKEQSRHAYLQNDPQAITASLKFNDEILFPELKNGMDAAKLQDSVSAKVEMLSKNLKQIEVEMENLYALQFNPVETAEMDTNSLVDSKTMNQLDPSRVAKLTK